MSFELQKKISFGNIKQTTVRINHGKMDENQHYLRPQLIILIRYDESESNYDPSGLLHKPFHKIGLTEHGLTEAYWTSVKLLKFLKDQKTAD